MSGQPESSKTAIGLAAIAVLLIFSYLVMVSHGKVSLSIQANVSKLASNVEQHWLNLD